jgi:hypothetical protein
LYSGFILGGNVIQAYTNSQPTVTLWNGNVGIGAAPSGALPFSKLTVPVGNASVLKGALCADNGGSVKCYGNLNAGVLYGDSSSFAASDLAENYPVADNSIEAGDVVAIAEEAPINQQEETIKLNHQSTTTPQEKEELKNLLKTALVKATKEHDDKLFGVISTAPGVLLGDTTGMTLHTMVRPVAIAGRVPVKISLENGDIKVGDRLAASSRPGVAMKALEYEPTVGLALENFTTDSQKGGNGTGRIIMFVNLARGRPDNASANGKPKAREVCIDNVCVNGAELKALKALLKK